jgi:hypothetical protein
MVWFRHLVCLLAACSLGLASVHCDLVAGLECGEADCEQAHDGPDAPEAPEATGVCASVEAGHVSMVVALCGVPAPVPTWSVELDFDADPPRQVSDLAPPRAVQALGWGVVLGRTLPARAPCRS